MWLTVAAVNGMDEKVRVMSTTFPDQGSKNVEIAQYW